MYTIHFYNNTTLLSHIPPYMKKNSFHVMQILFLCVRVCVRACAHQRMSSWSRQLRSSTEIVYRCLMFLSFQNKL